MPYEVDGRIDPYGKTYMQKTGGESPASTKKVAALGRLGRLGHARACSWSGWKLGMQLVGVLRKRDFRNHRKVVMGGDGKSLW